GNLVFSTDSGWRSIRYDGSNIRNLTDNELHDLNLQKNPSRAGNMTVTVSGGCSEKDCGPPAGYVFLKTSDRSYSQELYHFGLWNDTTESALSPDGKFVAVATLDGGVWIIQL